MPVSASLWAASAAVRIASLDLCADEYLLMFARRDQVASVSRVVAERSDSSLWRLAQGLDTNRGRIEDIIRLRPTHLLRTSGGSRATAAIADKLGIRTITLPYPSTINDVARNVTTVAALTGHDANAIRWASRLSEIQRTAPQTVDAIFVGHSGQTVGPTSLSAQWMRLAGFRQTAVSGGRVTLEQLAINPPRVLLRSDYRRGQLSRGQQWLDHPLVGRTSSKSVITDGRAWTCAGPLMLQEIVRLRRVT